MSKKQTQPCHDCHGAGGWYIDENVLESWEDCPRCARDLLYDRLSAAQALIHNCLSCLENPSRQTTVNVVTLLQDSSIALGVIIALGNPSQSTTARLLVGSIVDKSLRILRRKQAKGE